MCGRFALRANRGDIRRMDGYNVDIDEWDGEDDFNPRYNIAPRTNAPVVRRRGGGGNGAGPSDATTQGQQGGQEGQGGVIIQTMKWGLVPHWSKFENLSLSTTNARSENIVEGGGMWGSIRGKKRCAIPCQGYYEWLTKGKEKLPHFTKRKDGKLLLMAGLYDSAVIDGRTLWTFTIVTTDANPEFSWLHERQPVFLTNHDALMRWLDTSSGDWTPELTKMVRPYSDKTTPLECYPVPKEVGKVGTESDSFIQPITSRKDGIQAMFAKQRQLKPPASPKKEEPASPNLSLGKRKREETPDPVKSETESPLNRGPSTPKKQPKTASPAKRKPAKEAPAGNAKISSFFTKK